MQAKLEFSYSLEFSNLDNFLAKEGRVCPTFDAMRKVCRLIAKLSSYRSAEAAYKEQSGPAPSLLDLPPLLAAAE